MSLKKRFDLHQVLNYRVDVERLRKQDFATAKQERDRASDRLEKELAEVASISRHFTECHSKMTSIVELQMYTDFFTRKRHDIQAHQERVDSLSRTLEIRREELVLATQDKKVLEALKEKKELAFRQELRRKENDFLDEISVQKKGREQ